MSKKIKFLLVASTCVLVLIIVAVVAQSLIRQRQADRVVTSIKESVSRADNKQKALELALQEYKDDLEFVRAHRPLIKIELQESKATSCGDLLTLLIYAEALYNEGGFVYVPVILALLNAFECAL